MKTSIANHTTCSKPPIIEPVPMVPQKKSGMVQGTTKRKIGTSPEETASQPTKVLARGAKIYGTNRMGFNTIGKPNANGS